MPTSKERILMSYIKKREEEKKDEEKEDGEDIDMAEYQLGDR